MPIRIAEMKQGKFHGMGRCQRCKQFVTTGSRLYLYIYQSNIIILKKEIKANTLYSSPSF
jgi:hypothetical protein